VRSDLVANALTDLASGCRLYSDGLCAQASGKGGPPGSNPAEKARFLAPAENPAQPTKRFCPAVSNGEIVLFFRRRSRPPRLSEFRLAMAGRRYIKS
jgi:hypothetical protein